MTAVTAFHRRGNSGALYLSMAKPLQAVADRAGLIGLDFQIIVSYRDPAAQMGAYMAGKSRAKPGQSPHNFKPSRAFDFLFHPFVPLAGKTDPWGNIPQFRASAHVFLAAGHVEGVPVTWGADWDSDGDETDQTLMDYDHIELTGWKGLKL